MGHLINPIAFRLNFFKSWEDTWFVKNIYYPEFFNGILKIRNYLYFFLTNKKILKSGIFLSNFFIVKYNKIYIVNIYIYHIDFEKLSFESMNNLYSSFFNYNRIKKIRKINKFFKLFISNIDIFFFLIFSYKIFYKGKLKKKIYQKYKINYIKGNLFIKSNELANYYKQISIIGNNLILNKLKLDSNNSKDINANNKDINVNNKDVNANNDDANDYDYKFLLNYKNILKENNLLKEYKLKEKFKVFSKEKKNFNLISNFSLFEFFIFLLKRIGFNYKSKVFNKIYKLKYAILLLNIFKHLSHLFIKVKSNYNFLLFFLVVLLKSILLHTRFGITNKNKFRNKVYILLYNYLGYKFFFKELILIKGFLNSIFFILNKLKNICYKFFFLSNKNITSRWLCRYIGIKLKNNYSFYSVVNPVKKELHKLCKLNKRKNFNKILKFKNLIKVNSIDYKLKFKNLIKNFFLIYTKENYLYYMGNNNYIYDIFIFFFYKKKINKYMKLYEFLKLYKYIYINIFINYYWEFSLLKKKYILCNLLYKIYNFTLINLNKKFSFDFKKFFISIFFMKNLLSFNYFKYIWLQIKKINARNLRSSSQERHFSSLVGYKMAFKGRFSRKQRASNVWYMHGKMPLNTLSIKLDYYFFTIPLKNSAISIKIILYKNLCKDNVKYLLTY